MCLQSSYRKSALGYSKQILQEGIQLLDIRRLSESLKKGTLCLILKVIRVQVWGYEL